MPTLLKYSGIKACEDFVQRVTYIGNENASDTSRCNVRHYFDVDGNEIDNIICSTYSSWNPNAISNLHYLSIDTIKASEDNYDPSDYNGTSTGTCQFTRSVQSGGVSYQIQFTANESAGIKCFKFFKKISKLPPGSNTANYPIVLMFAIYFDSPISVVSGDILNMSVNFAYDDQQVTII